MSLFMAAGELVRFTRLFFLGRLFERSPGFPCKCICCFSPTLL